MKAILFYCTVCIGLILGSLLFQWPRPTLIITALILTQLALGYWLIKK